MYDGEELGFDEILLENTDSRNQKVKKLLEVARKTESINVIGSTETGQLSYDWYWFSKCVCISLISKVEYLKACKKKTKNYWSVRWNLIFGELRRTMIVRLKKNGIMRIIIRAIPELTRQLMKK